jgi:hypothetical protein
MIIIFTFILRHYTVRTSQTISCVDVEMVSDVLEAGSTFITGDLM